MKRDRVAGKRYELFPVGVLREEEGSVFAHIMPDYRLALKYLELFSHVIIFLEGNREYDPCDCLHTLKSVDK